MYQVVCQQVLLAESFPSSHDSCFLPVDVSTGQPLKEMPLLGELYRRGHICTSTHLGGPSKTTIENEWNKYENNFMK